MQNNNISRRDVGRAGLLLFLGFCRIFYWHYRFPLVDPHAGMTIMGSTKILDPEEEELTCIGWRRQTKLNNNHNCSKSTITNTCIRNAWRWMFGFLLDGACDQPIPKGSAGVCELQTRNGTMVHAMDTTTTSCGRTNTKKRHRKAKFLTCNMAMDFRNYKHQAHAYQEDPPLTMIPVTTLPATLPTTKRRGIVMSVYDDVMVSAYAVIRVVRKQHNCTLPIELWSKPGEIQKESNLFRLLLHDLTITQRRITDDTISGFMTKPYVLYHSHFDEVLLLDADSVPLKDPTYLFDTPQFLATGAIFFPDYWSPQNTVFDMTSESLLWELLGLSFAESEYEFEMESGQLLVDKSKSETALHSLLFLARTFEQGWLGPLQLAYGDKDLFRFAWKMTNTTYHYIQKPPSTAGFSTSSSSSSDDVVVVDPVCGVTLMQHDPKGDPIFLHRNTVKLNDQTGSLEKVWLHQQTFVGDNPIEQYRIQSSPIPGRKIKCYHPTPWSSQWFEVTNLTGSTVERVEDALLQWAREGLHLSRS